MMRININNYKKYSDVYKHKILAGIDIDYILIGVNGIYILSSNELDKFHIKEIVKSLKIEDKQLFVFNLNEHTFYDYEIGFVEFDDIEDAFQNSYKNHFLTENSKHKLGIKSEYEYCFEIEDNDLLFDDLYSNPIIKKDEFKRIYEQLEASQKIQNESKYKIEKDGTMYVKKEISQSVAGFHTFVTSNSVYVPCMDMDGDKFILLTSLGGLFGIHKFITGNILQAIIYLFTFGFCGSFYVLDVLSILLGGYSQKKIEKSDEGLIQKKYYSRPVRNKLIGFFLLLLSVIIAYLGIKYLFLPLMQNFSIYLGSKAENSQILQQYFSSQMPQIN